MYVRCIGSSNIMRMKRTQINLTQKEWVYLKKKSEETGLSISELIRGYVEKEIEEKIFKGC